MKELLRKYKLVIKFILTFLLVYATLTISYKIYLDKSDGSLYYPDYMTNLVAKQTSAILNSVGYEGQVLPHENEPSMKVIINRNYVARVIEGCNSVSIIILFVSFVIAFGSTFKATFLYILAGAILIYSVNLIRIVVLSIGLYHYPWRREFLHTVVFPMIIYGLVFILWMIWVNRFKKHVTVDD
ncbi:MAG: exosortase family protein XrtF [Winogradskyella sp.]|nr:exosortase family protein XrtF [Winogradskyella sp.]